MAAKHTTSYYYKLASYLEYSSTLVLARSSTTKLSPGGQWLFTLFPLHAILVEYQVHGTEEFGHTQVQEGLPNPYF